MSTSHDYPAAHSMDTTWWGLDRDGRIARFDTGEAGAALSPPREEVDTITLVSEAEGFSLSCDDLFPIDDGKIFRRPSHWDDESSIPLEVTAEDDNYLPSFLLWLRDDAALTALRADPRCAEGVVLPSRGRIVVWLVSDYRKDGENKALLEAVLALRERGHVCRGWLYPYGDLEPERLGIFSYRLDHFDNWIAGPFTRSAIPEFPLLVDQIPVEASERLALNELDADFSRDALLQPYEHGEAYSWEEQWVSTTGRVLETEGEEPDEPSEEIPSIPAPASTIGALVAAYLSGAPGSSDVLGDWLTERGMQAIPEAPTAGERLDELMFRWFSPADRVALEARFLEQVLRADPPGEEVEAAVRGVLAALGGGTSQDSESTRGAFVAWQPSFDGAEKDPRDSQLAWAAWALGSGYPLVAARTIRELSPQALSWQISETIAAIESTTV